MDLAKPFHCLVVGGGISGLALAHRLKEISGQARRPVAITVLEAGPRWGGVIETESRDGLILEGGADAFITEKPAGLDLCRRIGLADELIETQPQHRRSFVLWRGRLVALPPGFMMIAPQRSDIVWNLDPLSWAGRLRMACEPWIPARRNEADESVASFVRRRLGKEALERIAQPMVGGIYGARAEHLSVQATLPKFRELERQHGSLIRGLAVQHSTAGIPAPSGPRYSLFVTLRGGMDQLVQTLTRRLVGVSMRTRAPVASIRRADGRWFAVLQSGETLEADALCLALPAVITAELLKTHVPNLAGLLSQIPYGSLATVNLAYRRRDVRHPLDGFGFVVPRSEKRRLIGCSFSSVKFSGRSPLDTVLVRAFFGSADAPCSEGDLIELAHRELREILGISSTPVVSYARRYPRAMPQYAVGHLDLVRRIEEAVGNYPGLYLIGNGLRGLGIPDCIRQAEETAERIIHGH